ncbi:MAG: PBS lyase [Planctomycetes bacterium]|nr:PBS lyase [Planctomycetota bacterium]
MNHPIRRRLAMLTFSGAGRCFTSAAVALLLCGVARAADKPSAEEDKLIAILQSGAPQAEKAITCKKLAIHGSKAAAPSLAPLLLDEKLTSWARIALEAIPGPEADAALIGALQQAQGRTLIGVINSIGVRRNKQAVNPLSVKLKSDDAEVASAAAIALGNIGGAEATKLLLASLPTAPVSTRSAVAEGCIIGAEQLAKDGKLPEAIEIYDAVRKAEVPHPRILEATRGAILARKEAGLPLLLEQLRAKDKATFQLALSVARELPGPNVSAALTGEIASATPERGALILRALKDRRDQVASPAMLQTAKTGSKPARLAALGIIRQSGDVSCLPTLLEIAAQEDVELAQASKEALAELPDKNVNLEILARLTKADDKSKKILIEVVGLRRIAAVPALIAAADSKDATIRHAALTALGATVELSDVAELIKRVASPAAAEDVSVSRQALRAACVRMSDREVCAQKLVAAIPGASVPTRCIFLETLGAMGGSAALGALGAAGKDSDPQLQDVASRMLGQWMTVDAAPVLLDLAKNAPEDKYKTRALRGCLRITRQFTMPDRQRAELCNGALTAATRPEEQKLVLEILQRYPNADTLAVAVQAAQMPALKQEGSQLAAAIAKKLSGQDIEAGELVKQLQTPVKLEIIKAQYGAGNGQKDVTEALRQVARDLPLIVLRSPSYNDSFGGDPAPGVSKKLRIEYRINGAAGDASFAENAVIMLPTPK